MQKRRTEIAHAALLVVTDALAYRDIVYHIQAFGMPQSQGF
ncbi:MAG TPA: hypothetical protein VHL58_11895 [Thermoanaerobaculia bacterium]|nr:hypothetical protein [Thermoanaerobaculia bacterium]